MSKYSPRGTPLTEYEREILTIMMEECGEVIKAASKLIRFGREQRPDTGVHNTDVLATELGDLKAVVSLVLTANLAPFARMERAAEEKREKLAFFLQHEPTP